MELADQLFDDRNSAARHHRLPTPAQDRDAGVVVAVVQDVLQQVQVTGGHRLEEVSAHHLRSAGKFGPGQLRVGRDGHRRSVEDDAAQ